jgi:hypothetical protein
VKIVNHNRAGAKAFVTGANLHAIGKNLERAFPLDRSPDFSELLTRIGRSAVRGDPWPAFFMIALEDRPRTHLAFSHRKQVAFAFQDVGLTTLYPVDQFERDCRTLRVSNERWR